MSFGAYPSCCVYYLYTYFICFVSTVHGRFEIHTFIHTCSLARYLTLLFDNVIFDTIL